MNLADMLCYADIEELGRIARTYGISCNSNSKNELIQSILACIGRTDQLRQEVGKLGWEEIRFMNSLLFDRRDSFSLEELTARVRLTAFGEGSMAPGTSLMAGSAGAAGSPIVQQRAGIEGAIEASGDGTAKKRKKKEGADKAGKVRKKKAAEPEPLPAEPNPREVIARFKHRGWLFTGHNRQNKYLFLVPEDLKHRFRETLARQFETELTVTTGTPGVYRDERQLFADDLYQFLCHLSQNQVPLNQEGYLYKRSVQQIQERFAVAEEPLPKTAWRFGYGRRYREYPARLSLMYDYCYYNGLIAETGPVLELTEDGARAVRENRRENMEHIYRFWLRLYKGAVPNLQSVVQWIERLASSWTTVVSLRTVLRNLIRPYFYDTPDAIFDQRLIPIMVHLGLLRIGEDEEYGAVIQTTRTGSKIIRGTYVPEEEKIVLDV